MLSSSFMAYFILLSVWSSLGLDRTDRLLINTDPQALQVQINHLIQELGKTNQEVSYLKSQLSSQHHQISSCAGMSSSIQSLIILKDLIHCSRNLYPMQIGRAPVFWKKNYENVLLYFLFIQKFDSYKNLSNSNRFYSVFIDLIWRISSSLKKSFWQHYLTVFMSLSITMWIQQCNVLINHYDNLR